MKRYSSGGIVPRDDGDLIPVPISPGKILVSSIVYDRLGASAIRSLNGCSDAEIIVVPDEKFKAMTPTEKMRLMMQI